MATWGTYEAGLKRIPPEQAVRAMNRLAQLHQELTGPSLWCGGGQPCRPRGST